MTTTKTPTLTRSTSGRPKRPVAASKEVSTSASAASATLATGPITLPTELDQQLRMWLQTNFKLGATACIMVAGADVATLTVKLPTGKRNQSLPPGDILVVILPPVAGRPPGVTLIEAQ